jgi:hypothetical protein
MEGDDAMIESDAIVDVIFARYNGPKAKEGEITKYWGEMDLNRCTQACS